MLTKACTGAVILPTLMISVRFEDAANERF